MYQTSYYLDFMDIIMAIIFSIVGGAVGLIITCILPMETTYKGLSLEIVSLQDNNGVNGEFYLGSGYVENRMKYIFYYKLGDNEYKMMSVDYDAATIKYTDEKPFIVINELCPTDALINKFAYDFNINSKTYVIHVPKGSILNNYSLDSQ